MISVLPTRTLEETKAFYEQVGAVFPENGGCVIAKEGEQVLGFCLYTLDNKQLIINRLEPKDKPALADGILRSALHVGVCHEVIDARYGADAPEVLFEKLGFIIDKTERKLAVEKLFKSCHGCHADAT